MTRAPELCYDAGMLAEQIQSRIQTLGPDTWVEVRDLTGTRDHYQALIVSKAFDGKLMIEQHRIIMGLFNVEIQSGELHALTLKTFSPAQYEKAGRPRL